MEHCLVTGGAGFIGSHLVHALVKSGRNVRVLDNLSTGTQENLKDVSHQIEFMRGDVRETGTVRQAVRGCRYIFHLAAICSVEKSVDDPRETHEVNVTGTLNVLLAAHEAKVKRVIYSSSSAVYGSRTRMPLKETDDLYPESPYGVSKLAGEYYSFVFSRVYGLDTVSLRYFNVYGPKQNLCSRYANVIPIFISKLASHQAPEIHWDGRQSRDFIYVSDVVRSNFLAIRTNCARGNVFNVGTHEAQSVIKIFKLMKDFFGARTIMPIYRPMRPGDVRKTLADSASAAKRLKFRANVRFEDGLRQTLTWFSTCGISSQGT